MLLIRALKKAGLDLSPRAPRSETTALGKTRVGSFGCALYRSPTTPYLTALSRINNSVQLACHCTRAARIIPKPTAMGDGVGTINAEAEAPFPLTDVDKWVLSQTDDEFKKHDWDDLKQVIGEQSLLLDSCANSYLFVGKRGGGGDKRQSFPE